MRAAARHSILTSDRYAPFLEDEYPASHAERPIRSAELATPTDAILTALAQLGLYQTETERAFISLFNTTSQVHLGRGHAVYAPYPRPDERQMPFASVALRPCHPSEPWRLRVRPLRYQRRLGRF